MPGESLEKSKFGTRSVLSQEEADKVVVAYQPRKFPAVITPAASDFMAYQSQKLESGKPSSFRVDALVAQQTGMAELERASIDVRVEQEAIARLKEIQEAAYQEAYRIGLDEGREKAFVEQNAVLNEKLDRFEEIIRSVETLKADLLSSNETHIMNLIFSMARKMLMDEVSSRREVILSVVQQALMSAQSEENITIRVSPADFQFIDQIKEKLSKDFDALKRSKVEAAEGVSDGGCIITTNYGSVNATIEQRVEKLWASISEKLPRVNQALATDDENQGSGDEG